MEKLYQLASSEARDYNDKSKASNDRRQAVGKKSFTFNHHLIISVTTGNGPIPN